MRPPILISIIKQIGPGWAGLKDDTIGTTLPFTLHGHTRYYHAFQLPSHRVRPTSHMRLRAHDRYTSSTLIGGKGGSGPSSLPTTLEGPQQYVNARWMVESTWIPTWHRMDHASWSLGLFSNTKSWR